jgi:vacuolar-type H+-ATPase subunit H
MGTDVPPLLIGFAAVGLLLTLVGGGLAAKRLFERARLRSRRRRSERAARGLTASWPQTATGQGASAVAIRTVAEEAERQASHIVAEAERRAAEIVGEARSNAGGLRKKAEAEAAEIVDDAARQRARLRDDLAREQAQVEEMRGKLSTYLQTVLQEVERAAGEGLSNVRDLREARDSRETSATGEQ